MHEKGWKTRLFGLVNNGLADHRFGNDISDLLYRYFVVYRSGGVLSTKPDIVAAGLDAGCL